MTRQLLERFYLHRSQQLRCAAKTQRNSKTPTFPIVWLQILKAIKSTSIERFEDLMILIKQRLPSQYLGENYEQLAAQFRKDALELTTAGKYDHILTLSTMKIFRLAKGTGNEDFRFPIRASKQKLEEALLFIGFKENAAANAHVMSLKLAYKDIYTQAEYTFRVLFDRKEWHAAHNIRDSKTHQQPMATLLRAAHSLALRS